MSENSLVTTILPGNIAYSQPFESCLFVSHLILLASQTLTSWQCRYLAPGQAYASLSTHRDAGQGVERPTLTL